MKNNKYGDLDAITEETEETKKAIERKKARNTRPITSLSAMSGTVVISQAEKLQTKLDESEKEKASLLERLEKAHANGGEGEPVGLKMPVTKQMVTFKLMHIDPKLIDVSPENERIQEFLDETSLSDILPSIKKHGQQQPGMVRPKAGGRFELIEGSRRKACTDITGDKYLAWSGEVPEADVRELSVIENKHKDVSPYEKAVAYKRMIDSGEFDTWAQLAAAKKISTSHVSRFKSCVDLDKLYVRILPSPSDMSLSYGETISALLKKDEKSLRNKANELLKIREENAKNNADPVDVEEILKALKSAVRTKAEAPTHKKPIVYKSQNGKQLLKHAVTNKGATKFELEGVGEKDLEKILQFLKKTMGIDRNK